MSLCDICSEPVRFAAYNYNRDCAHIYHADTCGYGYLDCAVCHPTTGKRKMFVMNKGQKTQAVDGESMHTVETAGFQFQLSENLIDIMDGATLQ